MICDESGTGNLGDSVPRILIRPPDVSFASGLLDVLDRSRVVGAANCLNSGDSVPRI